MTLAQALKEKNRINKKIDELFRIIAEENIKCITVAADEQIPTDEMFANIRGYDMNKVLDDYALNIEKFIKLKTAIALANAPVAYKIIALETKKQELRRLLNLRSESNYVQNCNGQKEVYNVFFDKTMINSTKQFIQDIIDKLQDELDEFNASTKIEVDI